MSSRRPPATNFANRDRRRFRPRVNGATGASERWFSATKLSQWWACVLIRGFLDCRRPRLRRLSACGIAEWETRGSGNGKYQSNRQESRPPNRKEPRREAGCQASGRGRLMRSRRGSRARSKGAKSRRRPMSRCSPAGQKPKVALVVSGMQQGFMEPCGCTGLTNQKGGLMRRHTLIKQIKENGAATSSAWTSANWCDASAGNRRSSTSGWPTPSR